MILEGVIIGGRIELDAPSSLPDGTRVRLEAMIVDVEDGWDTLPPPAEPYDREKELAILREAHEDAKAGRGRPFEEFMAELAQKYKLPPVTPE